MKRVFYIPEQNAEGELHETQFKGLEIHKVNIRPDRAQIGDEKNEIICLVIMFTSKDIVIKISNIATFCIFC